MSRTRLVLATLLILAAGHASGAKPQAKPDPKKANPPSTVAAFDFATVVKKADHLAAAKPTSDADVPDWLVKISYDQWRDIRFRPEHVAVARPQAALRGAVLPPRASTTTASVQINVVRRDRAYARSPSRPALFDYGQQRLRQPRAAGPRLRRLPHPLPDQDAGLQRRGHRLPRRHLLPRPRQGPGLRPLGARRSPSTRPIRRARSSRTSVSSGWSSPRPAPRAS